MKVLPPARRWRDRRRPAAAGRRAASPSRVTCWRTCCRAPAPSPCRSRLRGARCRKAAQALDRYPYGCTEQTVSRALPLLYVNRLAAMEHLALDEAAERACAGRHRQGADPSGLNGSFGLWSVGGDDLWLDAYVTDFLNPRPRGREAGADRRLQPGARPPAQPGRQHGSIPRRGSSGVAYALYVHWPATAARSGRPALLADNKLGDFASPMAKGHLARRAGSSGDRGRSRTALGEA